MSHVSMVTGPKPHTHSVFLYWGVFFALVGLTVLTVVLAGYDFGKLNLVVTLLIAGTKAALVMGIFMHLAFDNKFFGVIVAASFVFLALFILFPMLDMETRGDLDPWNRLNLPRDQRVYQYELQHPKELPLRPGLQDPVKDKLIFIKPGAH
jgi:cytochrome c oxidase subunit 4